MRSEWKKLCTQTGILEKFVDIYLEPGTDQITSWQIYNISNFQCSVFSKNQTLKRKNQSEWKKSEVKKNEVGWPNYLLIKYYL